MDRKFKQIGNGIFAPESGVCMNLGSTHKREIFQIVLICIYHHHHYQHLTFDIKYLLSWLVGQKTLVWEKEEDASSSDLTPSLHPFRHHRHHHQLRRQRNHHQFFTFTFSKYGGLLMVFDCFKFYATSPHAYIWSQNI